jgi:Holliday junction resolvase
MAELERDLKRKALRYLKGKGYFVKYHSGYGGSAGIPDIFGCIHGRFIAIELKVKPNKPTELQIYNIEQIKNAGGIAHVCYSLEDIEEVIKNAGADTGRP